MDLVLLVDGFKHTWLGIRYRSTEPGPGRRPGALVMVQCRLRNFPTPHAPFLDINPHIPHVMVPTSPTLSHTTIPALLERELETLLALKTHRYELEYLTVLRQCAS